MRLILLFCAAFLVCAIVCPPKPRVRVPSLVLQKDKKEKNTPELESFVGDKGGGIKTWSSVTKKGDNYIYTYKIKNVDKNKTWVVLWDIANRATGLGDDAHIFRLKPGQLTTITVEHEDAPVEFFGSIRCHDKNRHVGYENWYKINKIKIEGEQPKLYFQMSGGSTGYLPKSLVKKGD
jgi:hypothetical protein